MKNNIALLSITCCLFLSIGVGAQNPLSIGVKAGVSLSNTSIDDYDMLVGTSVGVVVDFNLSRSVFIRSGLDFTMKGAKLDSYNMREEGQYTTAYNDEIKFRLNYLQLPLMVGYRHKVAKDTYVYIAGGAYFAYGIYGKGKYTNRTMLSSPSSGMNNWTDLEKSVTEYDDFDDLYMKRFDFGVIGSIGVEYGRYSLNIGYEYGFLNIHKEEPRLYDKNRAAYGLAGPYPVIGNESSWHHMVATCTLGYKF